VDLRTLYFDEMQGKSEQRKGGVLEVRRVRSGNPNAVDRDV